MRLKSHFKILHKKVTVITNSHLLKDYIEKGLSLSFTKDDNKSLMMSFILKNPNDVQEALASTLELTGRILEAIHHNYFTFHASAFSFNGSATLVLGDAGSGKSSTCFIAGLSGARIISDEPVLIEKKTSFVVPFRYLIKIDNFAINYRKWKLLKGWDFNRNRVIEQGYSDFNLLTKTDLKKLNINLENKKIYLKNIIFLEQKRYDSIIHLSKHCMNCKEKLTELFKSLNNLIIGKHIRFIPDMIHNLKDDNKIKNFLQLLN